MSTRVTVAVEYSTIEILTPSEINFGGQPFDCNNCTYQGKKIKRLIIIRMLQYCRSNFQS
jgi:hypothetical protein